MVIGRRIGNIESVVENFRAEVTVEFAKFVHAHRVAGKTYRQIAEAEGVSPSTIWHYARLADFCYGLEDEPKPKSNAVSLACRACGEMFTASRADKRFCSNACRQDAYRKRKLGAELVA